MTSFSLYAAEEKDIIRASSKGDIPEIEKLLISHGADLKIKNHSGFTAADYAQLKSHTELYEILKN